MIPSAGSATECNAMRRGIVRPPGGLRLQISRVDSSNQVSYLCLSQHWNGATKCHDDGLIESLDAQAIAHGPIS